MTKARSIASLIALLCSLSAVASAANPPKVVFIGDTGGWTPIFAAHPNWINKGTDPLNDPGGYYVGPSDSVSDAVLARFQADVVSQHPDYVHIVVGWADAYRDRDAIESYWFYWYTTNMLQMFEEAKAANIKIILGTVPQTCSLGKENLVRFMNQWILGYGASNNIPVINYDQMLCHQSSGSIFPYNAYYPALYTMPYTPENNPGVPAGPPTDFGYQILNIVAQNAITTANLALTFKSGYLTNQQYIPGGSVPTTQNNVNVFDVKQVIQFIPYATYSDRNPRAILNPNLNGVTGTWWSTNPSAMMIDQQGRGTAIGSGTARIWFQSLTGITFSPFDVTVQ